jgi:pyroglutamyl-peptidase
MSGALAGGVLAGPPGPAQLRRLGKPRGPVLLTGFEPFGGEAINPSWEVARALHGQRIDGVAVQGVQLPCVFATSLGVLQAALAQHRPRAVLCLGLAGSRSAISLERVAVNLIDARMPDNAGAKPVDQPVVAGGPAAHFMRLPVKRIAAALRAQGLAVELSHTAGSFVCNQVAYGLLQALRRRPACPAGFIHLPPLPEQTAQHPGSVVMPLADQQRGITLAIAVVLAAQRDGAGDLAAVGGITD